jgi:hypothetical protein
MGERDAVTEEFERYRTHLKAVAYRMLGSVSEAEEPVQESWPGGRAIAVAALTIAEGRIVEIDVVADQAKLQGLTVA